MDVLPYRVDVKSTAPRGPSPIQQLFQCTEVRHPVMGVVSSVIHVTLLL